MPNLREVPDRDDGSVNNLETDDPSGVDLWIMPYITDVSLWPVLVVIVVHVVAFVAPVILYAARGRSGPIVATVIVVLLTFRGFYWERQTRNKFGAISWLIVTTWIASVIAAYLGGRYDFL
ncbi:MAG: hypothetical protein ACI8W3_000866 [Myxococcota bacterium]|jgi:hypothetical protein